MTDAREIARQIVEEARLAFESDAKDTHYPESFLGGRITNALTTAREEGRKQGHEEAAKVCDDLAWSKPQTRYVGPELNCKDCAAKIRGLP